MRLHDLRHTFASVLIQQRESLAYVRDQLGHSSIPVTGEADGPASWHKALTHSLSRSPREQGVAVAPGVIAAARDALAATGAAVQALTISLDGSGR